MLNFIFHHKKETDKLLLPPKRKSNYVNFYLDLDRWESVRKSRGWKKHGAATRLAESLYPQCTRQYAAMVINHTCGISAPFMAAYVELIGIPEGQCWCHLFCRRKTKHIDTNHPIFNEAKYVGEIPYEQLSLAGEFRKKEYNAEIKKISLDTK